MKRTEEQRLEHIIGRMQTDRSEDAPADAIRYAKNLFRTRAAEPHVSMLRRILAVLNVELAPDRAVFGERSASEGQARQMLFEAGEHAVDLRIKSTPNGVEIRGQILGDGFENGVVELSDSRSTFSAAIDDMGDLELFDIPVGTYSMSIRNETSEIYIDEIILS